MSAMLIYVMYLSYFFHKKAQYKTGLTNLLFSLFSKMQFPMAIGTNCYCIFHGIFTLLR